MSSSGHDPRDSERAFYAGAATGHGSSRLLVTLAVVAALPCAWLVWSSGSATAVRSAQASPPSPSARTLEKQRQDEERANALDSGAQREQLISEIRQLRSEVAAVRDLLRSGSIRVEVAAQPEAKKAEAQRAP